MKLKTTRRLLSVILMLCMTVVLVACGSKTGGVQSDTPATTEEGVETAETKDGETVTIAISTAWPSLNPLSQSVQAGDFVAHLIFEGLIRKGAGGVIEPAIADSWEMSEDFTSITFHLNENAKWSDGEPVTADDVVFSCRLITKEDLATGRRLHMQVVAGTDDTGVELSKDSVAVRAIDDHTVVFDLKNPMSEYTFFSFAEYFYVLPEHLLGHLTPENFFEDDFWKAPVGCGRFTFNSEVSGERLVLDANPDYHAGAATFDTLVVRYVDNENLLTGLMNNEIDIAPCFLSNFAITDVETAEAQENLEVYFGDALNVCYLILNNEEFDQQTRRAFEMAINKENLLNICVMGYGKTWNSLYVQDDFFYDKGVEDVMAKYNPEEAKKMLDEAGWDYDRTITLLATANNTLREQAATLIQQDLAAIGVKVKIQSVDSATEMTMLRDGDAEMGLLGGNQPGYYPDNHMSFYIPGGINNLGHVDDVYYNDYFSKITECLTSEEIFEYSVPLQMKIAEESPYIYLIATDMITVYNNRIKGINFDNLITWNFNFDEWSFE